MAELESLPPDVLDRALAYFDDPLERRAAVFALFDVSTRVRRAVRRALCSTLVAYGPVVGWWGAGPPPLVAELLADSLASGTPMRNQSLAPADPGAEWEPVAWRGAAWYSGTGAVMAALQGAGSGTVALRFAYQQSSGDLLVTFGPLLDKARDFRAHTVKGGWVVQTWKHCREKTVIPEARLAGRSFPDWPAAIAELDQRIRKHNQSTEIPGSAVFDMVFDLVARCPYHLRTRDLAYMRFMQWPLRGYSKRNVINFSWLDGKTPLRLAGFDLHGLNELTSVDAAKDWQAMLGTKRKRELVAVVHQENAQRYRRVWAAADASAALKFAAGDALVVPPEPEEHEDH